MNDQKQYRLEMDVRDIQLLQDMIQGFPLGKVNVSEASAAANHAQQIMNLIGRNLKEVAGEGGQVPPTEKTGKK